MTKKDYEAIASIIRELKRYISNELEEEEMTPEELLDYTFDCLVIDLSNYFWADNERFDKERFKKACQI